ncbi:fibronectin type III domain-containing protein [Paenibacillus assamensis]|uniref:fibronectin type III domain-containing protein n=1 Tax=Paenibacillus assamensis TaxID=311244 RepID=UPI000415C09B|nr:fibronectin type III domain-containing protein [Paenibacillus assamensis]
MRKLFGTMLLFMLLLTVIQATPAHAQSKYTGGLLDGATISIGKTVGTATSTTTLMTDNKPETHGAIDRQSIAWYSFSSPQEISAVAIKGVRYEYDVEFWDATGNLLSSYSASKMDGLQSLPNKVHNVSTVVLKPKFTNITTEVVYEFNVFAIPSVAPLATTIERKQSGNEIVILDWADVRAQSYNVYRSTSVGGPYQVIASNVTSTTYTDKAVINNKTYHYVVTSVNEFGESVYSPEVSLEVASTKYTNGLLDTKIIQMGKVVGNATSTTRDLTDNNISTMGHIADVAWYTFDTPKEITSVIVHSFGEVNIDFYDAQNNWIDTYKVINMDSMQTLPTSLKNVSTVVLKPSKAGTRPRVTEWNVFDKSELPPTEVPSNLVAIAGDAQVTLNWNAVIDATSYNVKRATTAGGPYTKIATVDGTKTSYTDKGLVNGTTYYYVVSAIGAAGESANSNEASATPRAVVVEPEPNPNPGNSEMGNRAIVTLTLDNGTEKEYDLSIAEVNAFLTWYDARAEGKGKTTFAFDKHNNNRGPFKKRKEYIKFDSIYNFEVNGYESGAGTGGIEKPENPQPTPLPEKH